MNLSPLLTEVQYTKCGNKEKIKFLKTKCILQIKNVQLRNMILTTNLKLSY